MGVSVVYTEVLDAVRFEQYNTMLQECYAQHRAVPGVNSTILHMILSTNEDGDKMCTTLFTSGDTLYLIRKDVEGMIADGNQ